MLNAPVPHSGEEGDDCALRHQRQSIAMTVAEKLDHTSRGQRIAEAGREEDETIFTMGPSPSPSLPRAASAEYYPMTPEAGGRLATWGRPTPLVEVRHAGIGFEFVAALDALVLQMVDQLVDVLHFSDTFRLVVAEQVTEVPKIMLEDNIPQRTAFREPQLVERLVEVPTEPANAEQTADIPFPEQSSTARGSGGLQGLRPGQGFSSLCRWRSSWFSPKTSFNSVILSFSLSNCCAQRRGCAVWLVFSTFPRPPKKCEGGRALECGAGCALELIHERSSNGSA